MPQPKEKSANIPINEIGDTSRDQKHRRSLQPKSTFLVETPIRHTQSQIYGPKKKVKTQVPNSHITDIPEQDGEGENAATNRVIVGMEKEKKINRQRTTSRPSSQASGKSGIENAGFEDDGGKISRGHSTPSSVRSSLRDPSVQSLTVVREQYWRCAKWTPCERALFATVGVLVFIIIILVIAITLVAVNNDSKSEQAKSFLAKLVNFSQEPS